MSTVLGDLRDNVMGLLNTKQDAKAKAFRTAATQSPLQPKFFHGRHCSSRPRTRRLIGAPGGLGGAVLVLAGFGLTKLDSPGSQSESAVFDGGVKTKSFCVRLQRCTSQDPSPTSTVCN